MKYKELITFEPINEVVKFDQLSNEDYRHSLVRNPQIRNCCDKMPVWLIPIILLALAVMMVSYFS